MRHLIDDLDSLPYPVRSSVDGDILGRNITPMLASRGCARTCSFCSIHMFYRTAPGKVCAHAEAGRSSVTGNAFSSLRAAAEERLPVSGR